MEIAMPLQRKLIKSDFVRHMMFSEISKFLSVLTDNNCYYLIHNWIPKEGLLLISNEPFFFRKWQWRSQSYEILSSLGKTNVDRRGTTHQKISHEREMELFVRETVSGSRDTTRHARSYIWLYNWLRGLQYSCDCKETSLATLCRQLCGVTQFLSARWLPLDRNLVIATL